MDITPDDLIELRERDGDAATERPDYVEDAMTVDVRLGFRTGRPVVPDGDRETVRLGEDVTDLYEHYQRRDELLLPSASGFLSDLFESDMIDSVEDAHKELNTPRSTLVKACNLHDIYTPNTSSDGSEGDGQLEELELPSGESVPCGLLASPPYQDKLVLAQLLGSDGLSCHEASMYLRKQGYSCSEADVRRAAKDCQLLADDRGDGTGDPHFHIESRPRTVDDDKLRMRSTEP